MFHFGMLLNIQLNHLGRESRARIDMIARFVDVITSLLDDRCIFSVKSWGYTAIWLHVSPLGEAAE